MFGLQFDLARSINFSQINDIFFATIILRYQNQNEFYKRKHDIRWFTFTLLALTKSLIVINLERRFAKVYYQPTQKSSLQTTLLSIAATRIHGNSKDPINPVQDHFDRIRSVHMHARVRIHLQRNGIPIPICVRFALRQHSDSCDLIALHPFKIITKIG